MLVFDLGGAVGRQQSDARYRLSGGGSDDVAGDDGVLRRSDLDAAAFCGGVCPGRRGSGHGDDPRGGAGRELSDGGPHVAALPGFIAAGAVQPCAGGSVGQGREQAFSGASARRRRLPSWTPISHSRCRAIFRMRSSTYSATHNGAGVRRKDDRMVVHSTVTVTLTHGALSARFGRTVGVLHERLIR